MTTIAQQLEQVIDELRAVSEIGVDAISEYTLENWADRLQSIRAAVGGEAVAVVEQTAPEGLYARFIGAGRIYTVTPGAKLYASPTATVDVGALRELVEKLSAIEQVARNSPRRDDMLYANGIKAAKDELAALIDGAGNG